MTKIALSLGGNLGDVPTAFAVAERKLSECGLTDIVRSEDYITAPVDCPPGTPDFCNAALTGEWPGSAEALHALCCRIEREAGRPENHAHHESRTLDIDIVLFGDLKLDTTELKIPHPEARKRRFVLEPLADIAPKMVFPDVYLTVKQALDDLCDPHPLKYGRQWALLGGVLVLALALRGIPNWWLWVLVLGLGAVIVAAVELVSGTRRRRKGK